VIDLNELADRPHARSPRECTIAYALRALDDATADTLRRALDNPSAQHAEISVALVGLGFTTNDTNVGRHRRGLCQCGRATR